MAAYAKSSVDQDASAEDIQSLMVEKATDLFNLCDIELKGFITKRDMQRLQSELPLNPEQLEDVFDSLDDDGNGYLTLEEFIGGFGSFVGLGPTSFEKQTSVDSIGSGECVYENDHVDLDDNDESFNEMISTLGAQDVMEDTENIKTLWSKLRKDEPELLGNFEKFLGKVTGELKRKHTDYMSLESVLRSKSSAHDEELRKLYEEMETQIRAEKERVLNEEKAKERQMKDELEQELMEKDRQLQELISKHQEMEGRLEINMGQESETKQENEQLQKEREELEEMLNESQQDLEESRNYINQLRQQHREEKRERALAALQISEGIALERESLVKQLSMLRDMNKKLRDDRDEADLRREEEVKLNEGDNLAQEIDEAFGGETAPALYRDDTMDDEDDIAPPVAKTGNPRGSTRRKRSQLSKQGSVMSSYFSSTSSSRQNSVCPTLEDTVSLHDVEDIEVDDPPITPHGRSYYGDPALESSLHATEVFSSSLTPSHLTGMPYANSIEEDDPGIATSHVVTNDHLMEIETDEVELSTETREQPVGANSSPVAMDQPLSHQDVENASPERLFKVVFVGDSGVGKSSFIHRFCNDSFKATFSATIGVDFQVKNLKVDSHIIALQLWDTAGQERFRSITKQYFRKADGVIIMYDVTSETSFKNVVNWMSSVQDGTDEGTVLLVIGNKLDLVEDEDSRVVRTKDGTKLADEYEALFYETSAKSGLSVREALEAMSRLLRDREDRELEKAVNLEDDILEEKKDRKCCF